MDTWSIGMVVLQCVRGTHLCDETSPIHVLLATLFKVLGTPSVADMRALAPTFVGPIRKKITPQPWSKVLNTRRIEPACICTLERMLVWSPATRESQASFLNCPYFHVSTDENERCSVPTCDLDVGMASVPSQLDVRRETRGLGLPSMIQRCRKVRFKRLETVLEANDVPSPKSPTGD